MAKKKILVVDDETAVTHMLRRNLEATGRYLVMEENSGARALQTARAFAPDLILLDVMMPDADGGEVAACLSEDDALQDVPVVFLTAILKEEEAGPSGREIAGRTFLAKPIKFQELTACIERQFEG